MPSQPPLIEYSFEKNALRCKGKADTDKATCLGWYLGRINARDQAWAIVLWDANADKEPELYRPKLLLVEHAVWKPL